MVEISGGPENYSEVIRSYVEDDWTDAQREEIRRHGINLVADLVGPVLFSEEIEGGLVQEEFLGEIYDGEYSPQSRQLVSGFKDKQNFTFDDKIEPENLQSSAEIEYAKEAAAQTLENNTLDVMTGLAPEDRNAGIHIYDALTYEVVEKLQDEIDREFEIRVNLPHHVEFEAQDSTKEELRELTLQKIDEDLLEPKVSPEVEINGGRITTSHPDRPSLVVNVEDYTDEVEEVLSVFNLND